MEVVGEKHEGDDTHPIAGLGAAEDAADQVAGPLIRSHEQASVNSAGGHFDQMAGRQEAQRSHVD